MDRDKAIRAAKLTLGGMLEKKRHTTAVSRADGQIAPSKYLPNVPRAVHANGGRANERDNTWWHGSPSGDLRGGPSGLHLGTKAAALDALRARIGVPADGSMWDGSREYGKTLLAGKNTLNKMGEHLITGHNVYAPMEDYYPSQHPEGTPTLGNSVPVDSTWKPLLKPFKITGPMTNSVHSPHTDSRANGMMTASLTKGNAKSGYYYKNDGEDAGSISAVVPNGGHITPIDDHDITKADGGKVEDATPDWSGNHNFQNWFGASKAVGGDGTPLVLYHGTNQKIDSFDPNRGGDVTGENAGATKGFFFTDSKDVAQQYADSAGRAVVPNVVAHERESQRLQREAARLEATANRTGKWDAYEKAIMAWEDHESKAANASDDEGKNIVHAHLSLQNPMIIDYGGGRLYTHHDLNGIIDKAKAAGHDGMILRNLEDSPKMGVVSNHYVAFHPHQIKSVNNSGSFNPKDPRIAKAEGGRVGYGDGGKSLGLYSKAAQVIRNQSQAKGSVDQLLAMVSKAKGVKPAELANAGRPAGDTMSKEELAQHFEQALPKVDVERIGGRDSNAFPQYEQYTLPGGENYREHLLHLSDDREPPKALHRVMGAFPRDFDSEDGARQYIRQLDTMRNTPGMESIAESLTRYPAIYQREEGRSTDPNDFKSSHWGTPNVLAHVRMDDRDNGKTLHVQEVQSDWGQEGRENGFYDPKNPFEVVNKKTKEVVSKHPDYSSMWDAYRTHPDSDNLAYGDVRDEKTPQGPYVGNTQQWTDLALKHVLTEAAKGGHDRVVFSPGEANADMYGQRKELSKLEFLKSNDSGEAGILSGFTPNGYYSSQHDVESHADISKLIGKENAERLLAQPPTPSPDKGEDRYTHTLQGPLTVGGQGMMDYYKNYAHAGALKLLQQHDPSIKPESYDLPNDYKGFGLPMTETARQSILKNGFQAFQRGGEVHKATGGPVMGYVPMATLPTRRLINAPIQQQQPQANAGTFSKSLASMIDTVEGFKGKPEDKIEPQAQASPSAASEGHGPTRDGMSGAAEAAYAKLLEAYGQPLTINSSYRDQKKNAEVGGADNSQHIHGNAYDVDVTGKSYEERVALANQAYDSGFRGIGFYDNSMHFDVGDPRSWGPSYSRDSIPDWAQGFTEERYGYGDGGKAMDDNNNVTDLSTVRTMRDINSGSHSYGAQNMFSDLADKYTESKKAFDAAYSSGAFDNFDMGDMFKYKGPLNYSPDKIVGFTVKHISSWPQATKTYNDHYPAIEWETQNADRKVNNVPVEWLENNLHKYDKVGGKPKIVKSGGGEIDQQNGDMENDTAPNNLAARPQAGGLPIAGGIRGGAGVLQTQNEAPLEGLPQKVGIPMTGGSVSAGPDPRIRQVARDYMASTGMQYNPPTKYVKADPSRARRIGAAYDAMKDDPNDPLTKASYAAMISETMAQYNAAKKAGLKVEFWNPEKQADPYGASPRLATEDVRNNHHMWVYPTYAGYGSGDPISEDDAKKNPLLQLTGETWNGIPVTVNDVFRAIHDYYGHAKEGVGFRADGEENAWRAHASMFSPLARMAMTSETRGQNSWLNYGPHGEKNRTARTEDTVFAPQKIGVLPHWAHHEGAEDFTLPEDVDAMHRIRSNFDPVVSKALSLTRGFTKDGKSAISNVKPKGK